MTSEMTTEDQKVEMTTPSPNYQMGGMNNEPDLFSTSGYNLQYLVQRLGRCIKMQDDPTTFLENMTIIQLSISVVGLLGASISVAVTSSRKMRSSTSVHLTALGVYDGLFSLTSLILCSLRISGENVVWLASLCNCLWLFCIFCSAYVITCVTAERSLSIAKPYFMEKYRSTGLAVKLNIGIFVVGLVVNIPQILDEIIGLSSVGECGIGESRYRLTDFGLIYTLSISPPLNFVIPFVIVLLMNLWFACTLCFIRRDRRKKFPTFSGYGSKLTCSSSRDEGLIRLVIGLSAWYTVCWLLPGFYYIYKLPRTDIFDLPNEIKIAAWVDTLIVTNAAINAIVYFLLWRQFRLACISSFKSIFCSQGLTNTFPGRVSSLELQMDLSSGSTSPTSVEKDSTQILPETSW